MLHNRPDFDDIVRAAADAAGMPIAIAEKDYYVTVVLDRLHSQYGDEVVFKGGTSLSKGWKIIDRFSEDVDVFVRINLPKDMSTSKFNKETRAKLGAIERHVGECDAFEVTSSDHFRGKSRDVVYTYSTGGPIDTNITPTVRLEMGVRSGGDPCTKRTIDSVVAEFARRQANIQPFEVAPPFQMDLLDFTRTFVEKLACVHSLVCHHIDSGAEIGRNVRHYADLHSLLQQPEVELFAGTDEYAQLREDIARNTEQWFSRATPLKPGEVFANSPALDPTDTVMRALQAAYEREVPQLFYRGEPPPLETVFECLNRVRNVL